MVNGGDDRTKRNTSGVGVEGEEDEDDDDDDDALIGNERGNFFEQDRFIANDRARIDLHQQMSVFQQERHDSWHRAKLRTADVRRLVNQTLSQSVPVNVVTVVQAYTKMFAGILIEGAREVQSEWMAVEPTRADGGPNPAAQKLRYENNQENTDQDRIKAPGKALANGTNGHLDSDDTEVDEPTDVEDVKGPEIPTDNNLGLRTLIEECDRGPLLPDHLRESLRRYKQSRYGGTVGFTGLSLEGRDVAAVRHGGRRLFR